METTTQLGLRQIAFRFGIPDECVDCFCMKCDFKGICHCPIKDPDFELPKVFFCDNYMPAKNEEEME